MTYAQLLNDASEIRRLDAPQHHDQPDLGADTLVLELPIQPPDVEVPVIELFLKE